MNYFGNIYCLKGNVEFLEIWDGILKCLSHLNYGDVKSLPKNPPESLYIKNQKSILSLSVPSSSNSLVELNFTGELKEGEIELRICFDRNISQKGGDGIHLLAYEEKLISKNDEENAGIFFFKDFFEFLKPLVPKKYVSTKVIDTRFSQGERKNFPIQIEFFASFYQNYFFDSTWIQKICDELWFLDAEFVRNIGEKRSTNAKKTQKALDFKAEFESREDKDQFLKEKVSKFMSGMSDVHVRYISPHHNPSDTTGMLEEMLRSKIEITSGKKTETLYDSSFKRKPSYETFLKAIISKIHFKEQFFTEKIKDEMPSYAEKKSEEEMETQKKVDMKLRSEGKDMNRTLFKKNEELQKKLASQEKLNEELKAKITALKNEKSSPSLPSESENLALLASQAEKADTLKDDEILRLNQKNQDLREENSRLKKDNSDLLERISNLEQALENSSDGDEDFFTLKIPCREKNLFPNEIEDFLYLLLYTKIDEEIKKLPQNREDENCRKPDVLEELLARKKFDWDRSETAKKLEKIENILRATKRPSLDVLAHEGLKTVPGTKNHPKCYFYDEKYQRTFSLTPSDKRIADNKVKELKGSFFLL